MLNIKTTLLVNGLSSGATGIGLVIFAKPIAALFSVSYPIVFTEVGIFLITFAALVLVTGLRKSTNANAVKLITLLDTLWVVGSIVAVIELFQVISTAGILLILAVAAWVGVMALLQRSGLKQLA